MTKLDDILTLNSQYSILQWEPIPNSGEVLNVATVCEHHGKIVAKRLIREDVLRCMYGAAGDGILNMINEITNAIKVNACKSGFDSIKDTIPMSNFKATPPRPTWAANEDDLIRQILLMNFSLSTIADEAPASSDDTPTPEKEVSQQWSTKIRDATIKIRPELSLHFNREVALVDGGLPVRFAILTNKLAAQFGLLRPTQQNQGMEDARAKLWKLALAKERDPEKVAALVFGTPDPSEITLSDKQRDRLIANVNEIKQEAEYRDVSLRQVHTVEAAAASIVELA